MPNLMLTNWCNYKCPYCFGMDMMAPKRKAQSMNRETFLGLVEWMDKSNFDRVVHLMGGEPTLHPDFEWIVSMLLDKEYHITVFSNLATDVAPLYAEKLAMLPVTWVVNVNPPSGWSIRQRENIESALALLGKKAYLTFNIMPDSEKDDWAFDLIEKYDLNRCIKVGFVLPTYTAVNYFLSDNEYRTVAEKLVRLAESGIEKHITMEYECGIPTCAFTDEQLGKLWKCRSKMDSGCCSRLDITPEGEVIYCLPLSTLLSRHFSSFPTYQDAKEWFEKKFEPYRLFGRTANCNSCNLRNPMRCNGGCLAKNLINVENINL